jgi:MOSC domain-containing protein YiiM
MEATLERRDDGTLVRKAGVMAIVLEGGEVRAGDPLSAESPAQPHLPLEPV